MQLGQTERALDFYDQALKAAASIRGLQFPEATYVGKADALVKLNRFAEAEELLQASLVSDACTHRSEAAECVLRRPGSLYVEFVDSFRGDRSASVSSSRRSSALRL
jgi:tetratricopeptide (TPR) repeat protein